MSIHQESTLRVVLFEGNEVEPLEADQRFQALTSLLEEGYSVSRMRGQGTLSRMEKGAMAILGRFGESHPEMGVDEDSQVEVRFKDWSALGEASVADWVDSVRTEVGAVKQGEWKPWFPVIDYDRCTNCMQCLSFCLFGVYGVDEGQRIQVQNQDQCKTNCPACSRVCPEAAIMFPKYRSGPINGEIVKDEDLQREKMKVDISALLGGDVYDLLRQRTEKAKSRFSKERDSDKALKERQKCLVKLREAAADIPPEVLMSLPSPDEIQRRAKEAQAKAEEARARAARVSD